jgi:hypothetical protein
MGNAFAILWLFCPVLIPLICRAMKRAWGLDIHWGWGIPLGVVAGPIGLVVIVIVCLVEKRKESARAEGERRRAGRPTLDSSGPSVS